MSEADATGSTRNMEDPPTNNDRNDASRTLSRNSMYAPLNAYKHTGQVNALQKIPKSCTEASLVDFIHQVSADYHKSCQPGDPANTGNRPISAAEAREKVMYRTLSLFGREYGAKLGGTSTPPAKATKRTARRRKRQRQSKCMLEITDTTDASLNFLKELNSLWIQYIRKLIHAQKRIGPVSERNETLLAHLSSFFLVHSGAIEWVGARVCIVDCVAFPTWKGRSGTLVSTTQNTWVVFHILQESHALVQLTVPKRGSVIAATVNLQDVALSSHSKVEEGDHWPALEIHLRD